MKILRKIEIRLTFKELENLLKEKGFIENDFILIDVVKQYRTQSEDGNVKLVLTKNEELPDTSMNLKIIQDETENLSQETDQLLATKFTDLDVSIRVLTALTAFGIYTLGQIIRLTEREVIDIPKLGPKYCKQIIELLKTKNLTLKEGTF